VDNTLTTAADYTPFSIRAPVDPRLPNGGGYVVSGLFDSNKPGQLLELAQHSDNFGKQIENWQGVDVNVSARLRNGITVRGGTSTGRKFEDACALKAALPEQGANANGSNTGLQGDSLVNPYCRVLETYKTKFSGLVSYTIPKVGVQLSGTWRINPGTSLAANYIVSNTVIAQGPQPLGRPLSEANTVTVNLIEPQTVFSPRRHSYDMRVGKILRFGRTRTQVGVDIFNLTNNDEITTYSQTFNPATQSYLNAQGITPARYARFNVQFDF